MLISLVIFGLVFSGCAAKDTRAAKMNEMNTTNFAENMITSGNPILMGIGAVVGVVTLGGLPTGDGPREKYNALPEEQKPEFVAYMKQCMQQRSNSYYRDIYKGDEKQIELEEFYINKFVEEKNIDTFNNNYFWKNGTLAQKYFRDECFVDYPNFPKVTEPVTEQAAEQAAEQQTEAQNQTSTNQDEKVEEKQETKN